VVILVSEVPVERVPTIPRTLARLTEKITAPVEGHPPAMGQKVLYALYGAPAVLFLPPRPETKQLYKDCVRCVLLGNTPARPNRSVVRVAHQVVGQQTVVHLFSLNAMNAAPGNGPMKSAFCRILNVNFAVLESGVRRLVLHPTKIVQTTAALASGVMPLALPLPVIAMVRVRRESGVMCRACRRTCNANPVRQGNLAMPLAFRRILNVNFAVLESGVTFQACHRVRNAKRAGRESGVVCPVCRRLVPTIVARANGPMRLVSPPTLNAHPVAVAGFQTFKDEMLIVNHVYLGGFLFRWAIQFVKSVMLVPAKVFLDKILATCVPKENFKLHKELRHVLCVPQIPIRTALDDKCRASVALLVQ